MASPWICSSCRTRLPSITRGARSVSQQATRRSGIAQERWTESIGRDENGNGRVRGRYSGREIPTQPLSLRPETVLQQLSSSDDRKVKVKTKPHLRTSTPTPSVNVNPRQAQLDPALLRETEVWMEAVTARDLAKAWQLFRHSIYTKLRQIPSLSHRRNWLRKPHVQWKLHDFHHTCTVEWLTALQSEKLAEHTLPSPYDIVYTIEQLGFGKSVFYRPPLWQLAARINDMRLTHPNVDLQAGVEELMKMWRLTNLVGMTREQGKQYAFAVLDNKSDWSFLPPLTMFALLSSRQDFEELLQTLVPIGLKDRDGCRDGEKVDYASPALATLDLLRTTPCKMEDESVGTCSELPEYKPWVLLMETLLRTAAPSRVPVCMGRKLPGESEESRERYWRLLRRVGVKSQIVDAERMRAVYRNNPKDATTATSEEASATPEELESQDATPEDPTPQESTPQESTPQESTPQEPSSQEPSSQATLPIPTPRKTNDEEPRKTPHIKFTNPPTNPLVNNFALQTIVRLGRALERSDIHQTEYIRRNIAGFASANNLSSTELPIEVYEHLMMVLFALKNQQSAVEVWKKFNEDGYVPTAKTYTVMMDGASRAHDVTTMEKFWNAMRYQARLQPDAHAWRTRLWGLFRARLPQKGLAALSEMGKEWYTAAKNAEIAATGLPPLQKGQRGIKKVPPPAEPTLAHLLSKYPGDVNGVPRPNIVIMNSAIAALASAQHREEIPKVLHWGRTFGIEPDLITYNALLNICMRYSQGSEALALLSRMQAKGIQANSTTWTVLLTALFNSGFLDNLTHNEQREKIMEFVRSVDSDPSSSNDGNKGAGGLNESGYALIIDRLLKVHNNAPAATEVLHHMTFSAGLRSNTHIYTILMTHLFFPPAGEGPNFPAIQTLWQQIHTPTPGTTHLVPLDIIFYDRMVEGYATYHQLLGSSRPAMEVLETISEKGMKPGFRALEAVARMLVDRQEWDVLKLVVQQVRKRGRMGEVHAAQRAFWEFVLGTGILESEGIRRVEDLEGERRRGHWMDAAGSGMGGRRGRG